MPDNYKENPGIIPMLKELLGPVDAQLKKDLKGYKISELYGFFKGLIFIMSFAIGVLAAYSTNSTFNIITFGAAIIIYGLLAGIPLFFLFVYDFIHLYTACFKTTDTLKVTLAWQIIALAISLLLTFITSSAIYIYGGLAIFFILLFVYPFLVFLNMQPAESANIKQTIHKIYLVITILIYTIQLIKQFAHL
ncbi:Uncharacterised protein [uncultured archaeon]|nr:Uncharacterised protein [uncultured archaeon]